MRFRLPVRGPLIVVSLAAQRLLRDCWTTWLRVVRGVEVESLFDRDYYLAHNPDVLASGVDPLLHLLIFGSRENRQPHPLFDPRYYRSLYPDVAAAGANPLVHFLIFGGIEGRMPHPAFDTSFYLSSYPEVAAAGINPLVDFLREGAALGRRPHCGFDPAYYLAQYSDVAATGMNPLVHFLEIGASQNRLPCSRTESVDRFLAAAAVPIPAGPHKPHGAIDIVIPAYKGLQQTKACIESVLAAKCRRPHLLVVVDDATPELDLAGYLRSLARTGAIHLIANSRNVGFVQSVNIGMSLHPDRDVILLNSDAEVANDWLDRLAEAVYSDERIATATPFSNNATICSYPISCRNNSFHREKIDLAAFDRDFAVVNAGRTVAIPTGIGFCMYIRRDALNQTGLFDAEAFGKGYGEENDFCMRAMRHGWRHVLAANVFVYHAGGASFGENSELLRKAQETLRRMHPAYASLVAQHVQADPAASCRVAVAAYRLRNSGRDVRLTITHELGGGVSQHVRELEIATAGKVIWIELRPAHGRVLLECRSPETEYSIGLDPVLEYHQVVALLRACAVHRVHIHHVLGHAMSLDRLIADLGLPFDFTVHDYHVICPQIRLCDAEGLYCGEPDDAGCNQCIVQRPPEPFLDIGSWRTRQSWLVRNAERVIAPSMDVAVRLQRYFPEVEFLAISHPGKRGMTGVLERPLGPAEPLRIAVLGTMSIHKGLRRLKLCAELAASRRLPLQFTLIGAVEDACRDTVSPAFVETGAYKSADLPRLIKKANPHLVWFPAQWPETFSYTLDVCLDEGLPVVAPDLGAFSERLAAREWTWLIDWDWNPSVLVDFFLATRSENFEKKIAPVPPPERRRARDDFYPTGYLAQPLSPRPRAEITPHRPTVIALAAAHDTGQLQACGYIRVVLPLSHPSMGDLLQLESAATLDSIKLDCDVLLVQRTMIRDEALAESIVDRCRKWGVRLVYELDDDLLDIPQDHPEYHLYARTSAAARSLAAGANAVIVSTEALREKVTPINPRTIVLPNGIDERLWLNPRPVLRSSQEVLRILYTGTSSHAPDLEILQQPIARLHKKFGDRFEFHVAGVASEGFAPKWLHRVDVPLEAALSYPNFVRWLREANQWDIAAAPLRDTPFNRAKSFLKYLDYSALALPGIYSKISVFSDVIEDGETGRLTANTPDDWYAALEELILSPQLRRRLSRNCAADIERYTIASQAGMRRQVWTAILNS